MILSDSVLFSLFKPDYVLFFSKNLILLFMKFQFSILIMLEKPTFNVYVSETGDVCPYV